MNRTDLTGIEREILQIIKNHESTRKDISRILNKDVKVIKYHLRKLISLGLILESDHKTYKSYSLTPIAIQWLNNQTSVNQPICRLHWYQLKFDILKPFSDDLLNKGWEQGRDSKKWHWASYVHRIQSKLGEIYIEKTPKSFLISLPKIIAAHPSEADDIKNKLAFAVADYLKDQLPGLKIGILDKNGKIQVSHQRVKSHYGIPGDPLSTAATRHNMTLRSDRLMIDNSPKKEHLKDNQGNIYIGELEPIHKDWSQQDCITLFDRYNEMIKGELSGERIDHIEDIATGSRQMTESLELRQESQNKAIESLQNSQKEQETVIRKITDILVRIDSSMKTRDEAFANIQRQQETIHQTLNRLAYAVTALSERIISPLTALKEQIVEYEDINTKIVQRALQGLSDNDIKELKRHIGKLYW